MDSREVESSFSLNLAPSIDDIRAEVELGLGAPIKTLPCRLLYDAEGSKLFEAICDLPEYYPTRTELGILTSHSLEIANWIGKRSRIIEFGSGSGKKTRLLLETLEDCREYIPIDISQEALSVSVAELSVRFPELSINPLNGDYLKLKELPDSFSADRNVLFFPGSTIGNFHPEEAMDMLCQAAAMLGSEGGVLIGVDLMKDREILKQAYDDSQGITAAFNLNILSRLNRELEMDFDLDAFKHSARFNFEKSRMEMHLVSLDHQVVHLGDTQFHFASDESIHTENSYKYSIQGFQSLLEQAGLRPERIWTDAKGLFSLHAASCA
jgi:L-histidine Nalpha-methyltransferase